MNRLEKYAQLIVKTGANVQEGQIVILNAPILNAKLARLIVKECYEAGASKVIVKWNDDETSKYHYTYQSVETLCDIADYEIERQLDPLRKGACLIGITSPYPGIMKGVDPKKMAEAGKAASVALAESRVYTMANKTQWCVVAGSNPIWAKEVFPKLSEQEADEKLWNEILSACHVENDNDPVSEWKKHNESFAKRLEKLNNYNFKALHFKNSKGTDLTVGLVKNHIWCGGYEKTQGGIIFNPNMPTEEVFCMPEKLNVSGRVYSSKPLDYSGHLIDEFYLDFEEGKVVNFHAEKNESVLKELIEFDEGSCYIGEVALVPFHSPISSSNILFYNTLFDENASCHLALGKAYPSNVKGGEEMTSEELKAAGANDSLTHVDFMFGTSDLSVKGICEDGSEVDIFVEGDFVI